MRTIKHFIDQRAEQDRDKIFLLAPEPGLSLTYGRLKEESARLGGHLMRLGLEKGDKVSYMLSNGYQTTRIFLGAMYSGFVIAPLNLLSQPSQLEYVLEHSDTRLVFYSDDQKEKLETALERVDGDITTIRVDNDIGNIFSPDEDPTGFDLPLVTEDDDAMLLYTSGTTGLPKGVVLSHRNMVAGGQYTAMAHRLTPEDRALCSLPVYHINGAVVTVVAPLVSGGSVVMPHKFSKSNFWNLLSDYHCTWFSVVPTIISYLHSSEHFDEDNLSLEKLRFGRSASSALPIALHKGFEDRFKVSIIETMGLTETAAPVFSNPLDPSRRKYGSPGRAVGNEARIVDKKGAEVPRGTCGEIMIRGDNVMKGYYKATGLTAQTIEADGWLHTGDLGIMDDDGFVFVTGRLKELIIKGGENISPREIDEVFYNHPAVMDAAAFGIEDEHYGEEIMCCVVLKPHCQVTEEALRGHCLDLLGEFKTPKMIKFVDDLPKGPSGKIQRIKLRDLMKDDR